LIFLAFSVTLAQLAAFVMENDSCQGVSSLASGRQRFAEMFSGTPQHLGARCNN
jgi:hypothetical protein